jgi:hypothetical protein
VTFEDDPITLREGDNLSVRLGETGVAIHVDSAPPGAYWNAIARAWFVDVDGEVVRLDPQPPEPKRLGLRPGVTVRGYPVPPNPRIDL